MLQPVFLHHINTAIMPAKWIPKRAEIDQEVLPHVPMQIGNQNIRTDTRGKRIENSIPKLFFAKQHFVKCRVAEPAGSLWYLDKINVVENFIW